MFNPLLSSPFFFLFLFFSFLILSFFFPLTWHRYSLFSLLREKRKELGDAASKLRNGLDKIDDTRAKVFGFIYLLRALNITKIGVGEGREGDCVAKLFLND